MSVCRYWKLGSCSRGDSCIYLHSEEDPKPKPSPKPSLPPPSNNNTNNNKPAPPVASLPIKPQEESNNSINNNNYNKSAPSRPAPTYLKADMAANIKLKQLQTLFSHVEVNQFNPSFLIILLISFLSFFFFIFLARECEINIL